MDALALTGHTAEQFSAFLWGVYTRYADARYNRGSFAYNSTRPLPRAIETPLHRMFSIAEVSLKYECEPLKTWAIEGLRSIVTSPSSILSVTPSHHLARMLRLTFLYEERELSIAIEKAWILRLHSREIHPVPAILMGNATNLRLLLSHALYVHMISSSSIDSDGGRSCDMRLPPSINTHISCGYHSLLSFWQQLCANPPVFEAHERCGVHSACVRGWESRWNAVVSDLNRPPTSRMTSAADVLGRLHVLQKRLQMDNLLSLLMTGVCKEKAIGTVRAYRARVWFSLEHHFDL
jgi:hypothetical protein